MNEHVSGAGKPTPSEEARNLMTDSPAPTRRSLIAAIPTGRAETWSTHGIASCLLAFAEDHPFPNVSAAMRAAASHLRALPPSPAGEPAPIEANVGGAFEFAASHASLESECAGLRSKLDASEQIAVNHEREAERLEAEVSRLTEGYKALDEMYRLLVIDYDNQSASLAALRAEPDTRDADVALELRDLREFHASLAPIEERAKLNMHQQTLWKAASAGTFRRAARAAKETPE